MRIILISGFTLLLSLFLSGCSSNAKWGFLPRVHKIDVQQGNIIEQEQVNLLRPNMSRAQVHFIMGTPMLKDSFHKDRWDYIYRFKPGYGDVEKSRLTLVFRDDRLIGLSGDFRPGVEVEQPRISEELIVVPLGEYQAEEDKGYISRFIEFFRWTDEHKGIPEDGGDIPVNRAPDETGPASDKEDVFSPPK